MTGSPHEQPMTAIYIEGKVNEADAHLIGSLLARMGLDSTFTTLHGALRTQLEKVKRHGFVFEDLTSPKDILVAEHLYNLGRATNRGHLAVPFAWRHIINGGDPENEISEPNPDFVPGQRGVFRWRQSAEPVPLKGVVLVRRADTDLPEFTGRMRSTTSDVEIMARRYGVVVGSLLHAMSMYVSTEEGERLNKTNQLLQDISSRLTIQLLEGKKPERFTNR